MSSIATVFVPSVRSEPRGALLVGWLVDALHTFQAYRRVRREQKRRRTLVEDAASVRRMARELSDTDPGLAADLYAAANRAY
jgi:hypothetical protein